MTASELPQPVTKNQPSKICVVCGKTFYKKETESSSYWLGRRGCSRSCANTRIPINHPPKICPSCNQVYYKKKSESLPAWLKRRCCSSACATVQYKLTIECVYLHCPRGSKAYAWRGGITKSSSGETMIFNPDYRSNGFPPYQREHILIAEKVLGKPLPPKAVIHHVDTNNGNNVNSNLVICENRGYHNFIHRRTRALLNSGHANWLKCKYCKKYDNPANMYVDKNGGRHRECTMQHQKEQHHKKKMTGKRFKGEYIAL